MLKDTLKVYINFFALFVSHIPYIFLCIKQDIFFKIFAGSIDRFSTVINRHVNRKELPLQKIRNNRIMNMRKLKITELNRISAEEFKEAEKLPLVIVLDDIRSLHNIGSVFRTSDAFRIECIYLCGITATPPHPEMHKTALGAEFTVDWKYVNNAVEAVDNLQREGYIVYSVEQAQGSVMLNEVELDRTKKYAIVMGNEVKGVQQEVIDHSDGCIEIPQYGTKHSLNVSVTAGIVIWELFNQLKGKKES